MTSSIIPAYGALLDPHLLRMTFILGVIVAAVIYDRLHLTTGSIVVPGYLGASILSPITILVTFAVSLAIFWAVYKLMPHYWLMGGRQKFLVAISISAGIQLVFLQFSGLAGLYWSASPLLGGIGFVAPGLIAYDAARHGVSKTLITTMAAGLIVALVVVTLVLLVQDAVLEHGLPEYPQLTFNIQWIGIALFVSIIASAGLQNNLGLRAGGFVGSAYVSLVLVSLADVAFIVAISLATYWLVKKFLMGRGLILFGRRKFVSMMLCSVLLSWSLLLVVERGIGYPGLIASLLPMASVFVPGLYANDIERVGALRVAIGTIIVVALVLSITFLVIEGTGERRLSIMLPLAAVAITAISFTFVRQLSERFAVLIGSPATSIR